MLSLWEPITYCLSHSVKFPHCSYTREIHMEAWQRFEKPHLWTEEKFTHTNKAICWPANSYSVKQPPPYYSTWHSRHKCPARPDYHQRTVCHSCWTHHSIQFLESLANAKTQKKNKVNNQLVQGDLILPPVWSQLNWSTWLLASNILARPY